MVRLVTDYLKQAAENFSGKVAFVDENREITFLDVQKEAYKVAMALIINGLFKQPVAIFLDKGVECITSFMGVAASGNFYSPLDTEMPNARIEKIIETLHPAVIITDAVHKKTAEEFAGDTKILLYEELMNVSVDEECIAQIEECIIDTDILYILFTSGSTGNPKGVIISERALIDFIEWGAERFQISEKMIIGNQTPFYFSMSVFDIYQTLRNGATMYIIPREKFSFPVLLMQYMYEKNINTIFWVPSALSLISTVRALNSPHLPELRNVFFGGEVMPVKHLNSWIKEYPGARYVNFYGPTEVTDTCTVYEVNRVLENSEKLPIGFPCRNKDVFLLDDQDRKIEGMEIGELCVRGTGLAYGYYNAHQKSREVFVQNPLNLYYPEIIYRTGDLAQYNEYGELVYISRKDFQIKHMGHRIELGEIETAVSAIEGVDSNCCVYDSVKSKIIMFYKGAEEEHRLISQLKSLLPVYMLPNKVNRLEEMPINLNGKIDRQKLKTMIGL